MIFQNVFLVVLASASVGEGISQDDNEICCGTKNCEDYRGTISVTISGKTCQAWDKQTPHQHSRFKKYPNSGLVSNYCRNPDGEASAWCYTTDPKKRWELCDVPHCPGVECCTHANCDDYRGKISRTRTGRTCKPWSQGPPQASRFAGLESNYCRNPNGHHRAWCLIDHPRWQWDECEIPSCPGAECCSQVDCKDYRGKLAKTKLGRTCKPWSQVKKEYSPQKHPGAGLDSNFCRNPSKQPGAWCYTTVGTWDHCEIPYCSGEMPCESREDWGAGGICQNGMYVGCRDGWCRHQCGYGSNGWCYPRVGDAPKGLPYNWRKDTKCTDNCRKRYFTCKNAQNCVDSLVGFVPCRKGVTILGKSFFCLNKLVSGKENTIESSEEDSEEDSDEDSKANWKKTVSDVAEVAETVWDVGSAIITIGGGLIRVFGEL